MEATLDQSITWKIESIEQLASDLRKVQSGCVPANVFRDELGIEPLPKTRKEQMTDLVEMLQKDAAKLQDLIASLQ